jgi:hypothetical protein
MQPQTLDALIWAAGLTILSHQNATPYLPVSPLLYARLTALEFTLSPLTMNETHPW